MPFQDAPSGLETPPLFVSALKGGKHFADLLGPGSSTPSWLQGRLQVRVAAPSGAVADFRSDNASKASFYQTCLTRIGPNRAWTLDGVAPENVDFEVWTQKNSVELEEGPLLIFKDDATAAEGPPEDPPSQMTPVAPFFAVVRMPGEAVHVANTGVVFIDSRTGDPKKAVPRALIDFGLAGAFWGFVESHNAHASFLAAERLLLELFADNTSRKPDPVRIAASAHAVLIHRSLLPAYASLVLKSLETDDAPDASFLRALVGMAALAIGKGDENVVSKHLRAAIAVLANHRPVFGQTIRCLDANFSVISELMLRDFPSGSLNGELDEIRQLLGTAYGGGQIAAYAGEPPIDVQDRWHNVIAAQKKTLNP